MSNAELAPYITVAAIVLLMLLATIAAYRRR
jgi:hypothetical protein